MASPSTIRSQIKRLPEKPGVYQFYSREGEVLYIGKAKNLKKRVASYFTSGNEVQHTKTKVLIGKTNEIKYILVDNESDALLLENNLIKEYRPRYNILLKDDKTFPWICIKNEHFSRVYYTRKVVDDDSEYFGPYTSVTMIKTLFAAIKKLFKIRTCNYNLNKENIHEGKYKRCLEYYLGNCKAPCEALQTEEDYNNSLQQIREILKGNLQQVINNLQEQMLQYAKHYQYEEAQFIKQRLELLDQYKAKSTIVNPNIHDIEVFSIIDEQKLAYINFLKIVKGAIVQAHNLEIVKKIEENKEDILVYAIYDLRSRLNSYSSEIIVPFKPNMKIQGIVYTVPVKGDKKKLLDLSMRNVNSYRLERLKTQNTNKKTSFESLALSALKNELRIKVIPNHIECIDISNFQGKDPVASCIVFRSGKPYKSEYRHYHIKTVKGPNDYASVEEIVKRRYRYYIDHQLKLPDLVVIDGGKGQLNAALDAMNALGFRYKTAIVGIAKRLEEIYLPNDPYPLYVDKNSPGLKLIQRIRNEAHRFGITFHRNIRSKSMIESELDQIKGIGPAAKIKLLSKIKDLNVIRNMALSDLEAILGKKAGRIMFRYFHMQS